MGQLSRLTYSHVSPNVYCPSVLVNLYCPSVVVNLYRLFWLSFGSVALYQITLVVYGLSDLHNLHVR